VTEMTTYRYSSQPALGGLTIVLAEIKDLEMVEITAWVGTIDHVSRSVSEIMGIGPPERPNTVMCRGPLKIYWLGPNRWLLVRPSDGERNLARVLYACLSPHSAAVVDVGAGRSVFIISGSASRELLAKGLPLDLSAREFPPNHCAQTAYANIQVLVHASREEEFQILVSRSLSAHLLEVLTDAGLEFAGSV
jgi:sarcosine oxidase subunit gamma